MTGSPLRLNIPAIEPSAFALSNGAGCVNPPPGALFYPLFSTTMIRRTMHVAIWRP